MTSHASWIQRSLAAALAVLLVFIGLPSQADETITYIHWDALGSPVAATDEAGNVVWRESYRPYGERINHEAAAGPHTRWYTGHPQDADTGLIYAGARYYDPVIGRFLSRDPVDFQAGNVHSFNRYAYGNNNPYRFVDPDGRVNIANWRISGGRGGTPGSIAHWGGSPKIPSTVGGGRGAPVGTGVGGGEKGSLTPRVTKGGKNFAGKQSRQQRLKDLANDDKTSSADRGWIKQEMNEVSAGKKGHLRNPPGKDLAHERGRENAKGYGYEHSHLQNRKDHKTQHKLDNWGRENKER